LTAQVTNKSLLALHGGTPVRAELLPYGRQSIEEEDIRAVVEVLRSDWLTTGPKIEEFETAFASRVHARHAVAFSSGTAALHAAAFAAGLGPGDEAIVPPLTFCATANCVLYVGATPRFADVREDTLTLDPKRFQDALTPSTRAVLPVDYAGHPADLAEIMQIAKQRGIVVIEDACHALGAGYRGKSVGSLADMTVFSFHPVKHITTAEGGMVTTGDENFARKLKIFRSHGIASDPRQRQANGQWHYDMAELGYNYRLSDVNCALGLSQLSRLDANLSRRREIARTYGQQLAEVPGIVLPYVSSDANPAWHLFPIRVANRLAGRRAEIFQALRAENIGVNVHYIPVPMHSYYRKRFGYVGGEFPVSEAAYDSLISLPMFHGMNDGDVEDVVRAVQKVAAAFLEDAF
jgi:UDP-4-amino-4,6-dideoxy-N-acetyl-beta-L-altrosamine transaminase